MAQIELENVQVKYGGHTALDGISCSIESGTVGLLGPNGAGKSTFMKTILGFNRASEGSVKMFGMDMPGHALEVRQQLGYMPEREVVSPKVSAVSFLTYCGRLFGMTRIDAMERTHEVLNYVGLGEARYRNMQTYSTGMLQRVKLGQALVHDPKLLLLDEPTNGLDPAGRLEMLDLIRDVAAKRKVTILLSSHLLPDVQHVCDRIIMIHNGKIVREGTIDDLTAKHEDTFEISLRDHKDPFIALLRERGFTCDEQDNGQLLVSGPENGSTGQTLFRLAREANSQIRNFRPARHSLEEVFMQALGGDKNADI